MNWESQRNNNKAKENPKWIHWYESFKFYNLYKEACRLLQSANFYLVLSKNLRIMYLFSDLWQNFTKFLLTRLNLVQTLKSQKLRMLPNKQCQLSTSDKNAKVEPHYPTAMQLFHRESKIIWRDYQELAKLC